MKTLTLKESQLEVSGFKVGYADPDVLKEIPAPEGDGETVEFFTLGKYATAAEIDAEYAKRGLVPAPLALIAAHKKYPKLADEKKYTAVQWKDKDGNFCYLTFDEWDGSREVYCSRRGLDWDGRWFLAGVPVPRKDSAEGSSAERSLDTLDLERAIEIVKEAGYVIYAIKEKLV